MATNVSPQCPPCFAHLACDICLVPTAEGGVIISIYSEDWKLERRSDFLGPHNNWLSLGKAWLGELAEQQLCGVALKALGAAPSLVQGRSYLPKLQSALKFQGPQRAAMPSLERKEGWCCAWSR